MKQYNLNVQASQAGAHLVDLVQSIDKMLSKRKAKVVIDQGSVTINGRRVNLARWQVQQGDEICIKFDPLQLQSQVPLSDHLTEDDILFDRDGLVAINKAPGLPTQATASRQTHHAERAIKLWLRNQGRKDEFYLVHRLDKETSGVLIGATNKATATWMTDLFRQRTIAKRYLALCHNLPSQQRFHVQLHLSPIDQKSGLVRIVKSGGKSSYTEFRCLGCNGRFGISLIACAPKTGRSHQLRVHLASVGLPILGDKKYGRQFKRRLADQLAQFTFEHQLLHARYLKFALPSKETIEIEAPFPKNWRGLLLEAGLTDQSSATFDQLELRGHTTDPNFLRGI